MGPEEPSGSLIVSLSPMNATIRLSICWAKGCPSSELHLLTLKSEKTKSFFYLKVPSESQAKFLLCEGSVKQGPHSVRCGGRRQQELMLRLERSSKTLPGTQRACSQPQREWMPVTNRTATFSSYASTVFNPNIRPFRWLLNFQEIPCFSLSGESESGISRRNYSIL